MAIVFGLTTIVTHVLLCIHLLHRRLATRPPRCVGMIGRSIEHSPHLRPTLLVRTCLTVLCIAILAMHVSGAHLHLCFDGSDPPASVHLTADVDGQVAHNNAGKPHRDLDVSLSGEALAKKLDSAAALPALLVTALVLFATLLGEALLIAREHLRCICSIPLFRLRPPLRAPPS